MRNAKKRTLYVVHAPHEGDGPEDAMPWYFRNREAAEHFGREGAEHGMINPYEGPYDVTELHVSYAFYKSIKFTEYT